MNQKEQDISLFQRYLSLWVLLCMVAGVLIGRFIPVFPVILGKMQIAGISIPMAALIWVMIYPMMIKVDFKSIREAGKNPKGLFITWITNWLIKPFTMYGIASFFWFVIFKGFIAPELATQYLAGAVLLGAAPCTAMVFVWSKLTNGNPAYTVVQVATNDLIILVAFVPIVKAVLLGAAPCTAMVFVWSKLTNGNPAYTVVQVATNDLIILVAFVPIVKFLLGVSNVTVPYSTLFLSVFLFVVIPLAAGVVTRNLVIARKGERYLGNVFVHKFDNATTVGLLLTLILIFTSQAEVILSYPLHILLIAVPLILQTFFIFSIAYGASKAVGLPFDIAAPAGMIGASNFFELAVAVAVALFGTQSPAALATTVGVLTEVPVMLTLVKFANKTASNFFELAVAVAVALFGTQSPAALATTVGVLTEVPVMLTLVKFANKTKAWFD